MAQTAARRRVVALTGYLAAALLAAASLGLNRLDAETYREDAQALLRLQRLARWAGGLDPASLEAPMRAAARDALRGERPDLHAAYVAAREALTAALIAGLPGATPVSCGAFRERPVEGKVEAAAVVVPFDLLHVETPFIATLGGSALAERDTVARLVVQLDALAAPSALRVARAVAAPPAPGDPCAGWDGAPPRQDEPPLLSVTLSAAAPEAVAIFAAPPGPQHVQQALVSRETVVAIPAEIETVPGPAAARLLAAAAPPGLMADLGALAASPAVTARVRAEFGFLPVDYAVQTAGGALVEGFAGASLFGLRITGRRVTLAVTLAVLGLVAAIAAEAFRARRRGEPLADPAPEGPLALCASATAGRAALWSAAPAAAVAGLAPADPASLAAAAAAGALGALATVWAFRADRSAPPGG